jgi:hypothetical protein
MEPTQGRQYSHVIEYGGVLASFPARLSRKGVNDPRVSQT